MPRKNIFTGLAVLVLLSLALGACAGAATEVPPTQAAQPTAPSESEPNSSESGLLPEVDPLSVTGDIVTAGSSTVFPLAEAMAARFEDEGYSGRITIDSIGSGAGFERFCVTGETDISNASRPIRDSEIESCQSIGREPIEFRVGTDALAVTVSQENDFIQNATLEELALIFSNAAETWADVNPSWPDEPILRFIPGTDSGTFDYFVEAVFDEDEEPHLRASNTQLSEDDNVLVQGILGSPYAVGYFGLAYYQENADTLKQEKPQVADFINFFLTFVDEEIIDVGCFPVSAEALGQAGPSLLEAMP